MEDATYPIKKPKSGCFAVIIALFGIGMIITSVMNINYNFSFSNILVVLMLGGIGAFCCYFALVMVMKGKIIIKKDGIDVMGLGISYRQKVAWHEITSIQIGSNPSTSDKFLEIKTATSGLPIVIREKMVADFNELTTMARDNYERFQASNASSKNNLQTRSQPIAGHTSEDDVDAIRKYCQHLAQQWWQSNSMETAICEGCNGAVSKGSGVLLGSNLYCGSCANEKFGPSYAQYLRTDPNFYGRGVLEKAREYVAKMK